MCYVSREEEAMFGWYFPLILASASALGSICADGALAKPAAFSTLFISNWAGQADCYMLGEHEEDVGDACVTHP
jgi:hypothetical protein